MDDNEELQGSFVLLQVHSSLVSQFYYVSSVIATLSDCMKKVLQTGEWRSEMKLKLWLTFTFVTVHILVCLVHTNLIHSLCWYISNGEFVYNHYLFWTCHNILSKTPMKGIISMQCNLVNAVQIHWASNPFRALHSSMTTSLQWNSLCFGLIHEFILCSEWKWQA